VRLVATDLNPGMLAFAQAKFRANKNLVWQEADAGALPFPDSSFAVSQKIAEHCGSAPVESTMQAFVWRAVHQ
jgi:SAM-dependent methyltransferase